MDYFALLWTLLALIVLYLVGRVTQIRRINSCVDRMNFIDGYFSDFDNISQRYVARQQDRETMGRLLAGASRMQTLLGRAGIVGYQDRLRGYQINNYQVVPNTLSKIQNGQAIEADLHLVLTSIPMRRGELAGVLESLQAELKNPIKLILLGIRWVITLPLTLAQYAGVIGEPRYNALFSSWIVKFLTFVITLFGLLASVVTILLGWHDALNKIKIIIRQL